MSVGEVCVVVLGDTTVPACPWPVRRFAVHTPIAALAQAACVELFSAMVVISHAARVDADVFARVASTLAASAAADMPVQRVLLGADYYGPLLGTGALCSPTLYDRPVGVLLRGAALVQAAHGEGGCATLAMVPSVVHPIELPSWLVRLRLPFWRDGTRLQADLEGVWQSTMRTAVGGLVLHFVTAHIKETVACALELGHEE